jgi:hypothetical protein
MAYLVNAVVVRCPLCTAEAIVRVWSCGCQEVTAAGHRTHVIPPDLRRRVPFPISEGVCDSDYFPSFQRACGKPGEPATHASEKPAGGAPASRLSFE